MDSASGYPVQGAILLGAYLIAEQVAVGEDDSDARARMERALGAMEETLREVSGDFFVTGERPDLSSLVHGVPIDERRALLVELAYSNPFDPFEFRLKGAREKSRIRGLRMLSRTQLGLGSEAADTVIDTWRAVLKEDRKCAHRPGEQARRLAVMAAGGAAVAGAAVLAGPMIAAMMPAAAGLGGAAAVSAGLAQLGFGSLAAGGLGMTGGLWVLGMTGGVLGAGTAGLLQHGLAKALMTPGSAPLIKGELLKVLVSFHLAVEAGWFDGDLGVFEAAVDKINDETSEALAVEKGRNDPTSPRVQELEGLLRSARCAGESVRRRLETPPSG